MFEGWGAHSGRALFHYNYMYVHASPQNTSFSLSPSEPRELFVIARRQKNVVEVADTIF